MQVTQAELSAVAVRPDQYPQDDLPEFALVGRSNAGKSSLINRLINRKSLARTSSTPGKTQTLNFYKINDRFYFVDLPGYGYAKVSKRERARWGQFIEAYLSKRDHLKLVIQVVDIRHLPTQDDILMADWLRHYQIPRLFIATKADKLSKSKVDAHLKRIRKALGLQAGDELVAFSAQTGLGKEQVWSVITDYVA